MLEVQSNRSDCFVIFEESKIKRYEHSDKCGYPLSWPMKWLNPWVIMLFPLEFVILNSSKEVGQLNMVSNRLSFTLQFELETSIRSKMSHLILRHQNASSRMLKNKLIFHYYLFI